MTATTGEGGWRVQPFACLEHGELLRHVQPPVRHHPMAGHPEQALLAEALIASACHGTNWDRLRAKVLSHFEKNPQFAYVLASCNFDEFNKLMASAFGVGESAESLELRHSLMVDVASAFEDGRIDPVRWVDEPVKLGGSDGIFSKLRNINAFGEDPHQKKTRVLVQQMVRFNLVKVLDVENLSPAVEYHLIRLYLRSGRVIPATPSALKTVEQALVRRLDSLNSLRSTVEEAMRITANIAGISILDVNDAEWQIARSFCVREKARCEGPEQEGKPCDANLKRSDGRCLFLDVCAASNGLGSMSWVEPRLADRHSSYY